MRFSIFLALFVLVLFGFVDAPATDAPAEFPEDQLVDASDILESEPHVDEQLEGDFGPIEWEQFEPHGPGDYQDAFENTDFDGFQFAGSYMDDGFGEADWGDFDASLDFG